jgi:hypothetical protein
MYTQSSVTCIYNTSLIEFIMCDYYIGLQLMSRLYFQSQWKSKSFFKCSSSILNYLLGISKKSLKIPIKGVIRIRISKKNRQHNAQKKKKSTKQTHKSKDRVARTPLKPGGELRCSGRVSSSWSTSGTRRVNLVTNPVMGHEWGKDLEVFTSGTYPWSFVTHIFHNSQLSHGGDRNTFEVMTST